MSMVNINLYVSLQLWNDSTWFRLVKCFKNFSTNETLLRKMQTNPPQGNQKCCQIKQKNSRKMMKLLMNDKVNKGSLFAIISSRGMVNWLACFFVLLHYVDHRKPWDNVKRLFLRFIFFVLLQCGLSQYQSRRSNTNSSTRIRISFKSKC